MRLKTIDKSIRLDNSRSGLSTISFQRLVEGQCYILNISFMTPKRAVKFLGYGPSIDETIPRRPRWAKCMREGGFYFFKALDDNGNEEIISVFGVDGSFKISLDGLFGTDNIKRIVRVSILDFCR